MDWHVKMNWNLKQMSPNLNWLKTKISLGRFSPLLYIPITTGCCIFWSNLINCYKELDFRLFTLASLHPALLNYDGKQIKAEVLNLRICMHSFCIWATSMMQRKQNYITNRGYKFCFLLLLLYFCCCSCQ